MDAERARAANAAIVEDKAMRRRNVFGFIQPRWMPIVVAVGIAIAMASRALTTQPSARKLTNEEAASHVLSRLSFGPRVLEVGAVSSIGWKNWVDEQFHPEAMSDYLADKIVAERCPSLTLTMTEFQRFANKEEETDKLKRQLVDSIILRAAYSRRQFQEVMISFWRDHFNVYFDKVPLLATHYEINALRPNVFGKFEELLLATAKHPAMLVYLDNHVSRGGRLNENYARELMELHTLGADNGYTQDDVIALARTLTGWTCGPGSGASGSEYGFTFRPDMHDTGEATVVGLHLDGTGGVTDGELVIRHLANHPNTARFISTKLCRYLVHDDPPESLVASVAETFLASKGDLREVYRAIVFSPDFMDARYYRTKFKTPFEFVVGVLRTTGAQIESTEHVSKALSGMGQAVYECVEPTGYYDQAESWLDPGVMVYRWNFAIELVLGKVDGIKVGDEFTEQVLKAEQATRTKKIMEIVLPGVTDSATKRLILQTGDIREMVALALGSPAYQQQ